MKNIEQGTVRASKKQNALIKLQRKYKGYDVRLTLEKVGNNEWEYIVILKEKEGWE